MKSERLRLLFSHFMPLTAVSTLCSHCNFHCFLFPWALVSAAQLINAPPTHQLGLVMLRAKQSQWNSAVAGAPAIIHNLGQRSTSAIWVNEQLCIYHLTSICHQSAAWQNSDSHPLGLPLALHILYRVQQAVIRHVPYVVLAPSTCVRFPTTL